MERLLKTLALAVALAFLVGAVLTAATPADAAPTPRDAGAAPAQPPTPDASAPGAELLLDEDIGYFSASKSGPLPRPKRTDAGVERRYLPATKSPGGMFVPTPQQQAR